MVVRNLSITPFFALALFHELCFKLLILKVLSVRACLVGRAVVKVLTGEVLYARADNFGNLSSSLTLDKDVGEFVVQKIFYAVGFGESNVSI